MGTDVAAACLGIQAQRRRLLASQKQVGAVAIHGLKGDRCHTINRNAFNT
jgi:hypothetical protein